jgi:hypothetical protein
VENDGDDYDIEVMEENKEDEEEDEEGLEEYYSLQPYEIFEIVMNPEKKEKFKSKT